MIDAVRAEWIKIIRNARLTAALVWIFPIAAATTLVVGFIISLVSGGFAAFMGQSTWSSDLVAIWGVINRFPVNVFGRMLPLAFMAVVFAGEFQWETWRLIVPRAERTKLLLAKLAAIVLAVTLSLALASVIMVALQAAGHAALGEVYGPDLTVEMVSQAARNLLVEALIASLTLLLLGAFAAVSAFITKTVLGALMLSFGFSLVELLSLGVLALLSSWFDRPGILNLYRYMPNFNLENLRAWVIEGHGLTALPFNLVVEASLGESLLFVGIWITAVVAWANSIFRRQDITT